ncbi:unnamed protein product, partial [Rotaria magnacalcarata]
MKARTLNATHEMIKTLLPEQTVEHVRTNIIVSFAYHPHLSDKRSNEQQNLTSLPVKRLKTTAFGSTQQ